MAYLYGFLGFELFISKPATMPIFLTDKMVTRAAKAKHFRMIGPLQASQQTFNIYLNILQFCFTQIFTGSFPDRRWHGFFQKLDPFFCQVEMNNTAIFQIRHLVHKAFSLKQC